MLAHRNGWIRSGRLILPPLVENEADELVAAGRISRLGDHWQAVIDASKHHRYWGGHFVIETPDEEMLEVQVKLEHVIVSQLTEQERRDDIQVAEYIAQNRIERRLLGVSQDIERKTNASSKISDPRVVKVALAPEGLVSIVEITTLYVLDNDMYFNASRGTVEYGGLTIAEWLRGYCVLEQCYAGEGSEALVEIDACEFRDTLHRAGLSKTKVEAFVERATFQSGRRDLYDAPLLTTTDGKIFFAAALYRGVNVALIIASQLGSQELNIDSKGEDFEKGVLKMFKDAGIPAATFKFTLRDTQYQCDVAVLWDGHLFIFECKNYGLPGVDPSDRFFFWKKQAEAMRQVERIAADLDANPVIVKEHFGAEATWSAVHPVVLNASFISFFKSPSGTFFYDGSALGRFLKEGTLNQVWRDPPSQGGGVRSFVVKRLWSGKRPKATDLLRAMKRPAQMMLEQDNYYIARRLLLLSESTALLTMAPASKGPDFEPLLTSEDRRHLRDLVSRRKMKRKRKRA